VHSISFKFLALILISTIAVGVGINIIFSNDGVLSTYALYLALLVNFILLFLIFLQFIAAPLWRVVREMKLLLTGQKYKRIKPSSADEIGIVTHFFNKITLSLESISGDILESKRLTSELDIARDIQKKILPSEAPPVLGLDIVARSRPAAEMGGDSFDFIRHEQNALIYIGDVTGHGVPSGLIMMMVNTMIHAFAEEGLFPHEIIRRVNAILNERISSQQFMTMVMLRWDERTSKMYYLGAGHEHILIYRAADKKVEKIRTGGIALRMAPDIENFLEEKELLLAANDVILLYSDGIIDGHNQDGDMYGLEKLMDAFRINGAKANTEKIFDGVTKDFSDFIGKYGQQEDDITLIAIKKLPEGAAARTPIKLTIGGLEEAGTFKEEKRWEWEKE